MSKALARDALRVGTRYSLAQFSVPLTRLAVPLLPILGTRIAPDSARLLLWPSMRALLCVCLQREKGGGASYQKFEAGPRIV